MAQEDKQRKDRMLAKARGQSLPEGVTGQLPLPPAKAVSSQPARSRESQQTAQRGQRARPMTPTERKALESIGWDPSQPVPSNTADILAQLVAERAGELHNLPPPVDPRTPKLNVEIRELGALSESEKERARYILTEAAKREAADRHEQSRRQAVQQRPDGVRQVIEQLEVVDDVTPKAKSPPAARPAPSPVAPTRVQHPVSPSSLRATPSEARPASWDDRVAAYQRAYTLWHGRNLPLIQAGLPTEPPPPPPQMSPEEQHTHYQTAAAQSPVVDLGLSHPPAQASSQLPRTAWVPDETYVPISDEELEAQADALQADAATETPQESGGELDGSVPEEPPPETGADVPMTECPHCRFPLHMEDIPEPNHHEKMAFLASILAGKPYLHEHVAMGGILRLTFRTLTLAEIDAIHAQAHRDTQEGRAVTKLDFYERINRYRLYLQLQSLRVEHKGSAEPPAVHEQPHGLDLETNGRAASHWSSRFERVNGQSILPFIEMNVTSTILPNEHMFRIAMQACDHFNRTVAKLEALVDNSDFWNAIAPQS